MNKKMSKQELIEMLPDNPELQEKLNALTDDDLADITAGLSLYESSEGVNRNSWFVTLLMRFFGRQPDSRSGPQQEQAMVMPTPVPEPPEVVRSGNS